MFCVSIENDNFIHNTNANSKLLTRSCQCIAIVLCVIHKNNLYEQIQ